MDQDEKSLDPWILLGDLGNIMGELADYFLSLSLLQQARVYLYFYWACVVDFGPPGLLHHAKSRSASVLPSGFEYVRSSFAQLCHGTLALLQKIFITILFENSKQLQSR
jgi:hypothetical protein